MTDLSEGGRLVVESLTNRPVPGEKAVRLGTIANIDELQESLRDMARRAADHGIRVPSDSLFFRFQPGNSSRVDCVIGDFERTFYAEGDEVDQDLYRVNLEHAFLSLQGWLLYRNEHQKQQIQRKPILRGLDEELFKKHWGAQDEDMESPLSLKLFGLLRRVFRKY